APDADVGLIYISVCGPDGASSSREYRWGKHPRELVKFFATQRALFTLLRELERQARPAMKGARAAKD
ncbi:MAG: hypothetical protein FJZ00_09810, partial [Candidatus Sericytochromatia bacterium]|nr:hypothetical protein [Candidatus Tanganyikabacteria bacterium]